MTHRASVCVVAAVLALSAAAHAEDRVLSAKSGQVDVKLFIPGETKVLRGLLIHAANYSMNPQDRWAELSRAMGWAHVALNIDRNANNRPTKLRQAMEEMLKQWATEAGHPELPNLPLMGVGHSAGGMVTPAMLKTPERTVTSCVSCGWIADPKKTAPGTENIPMLFTIGSINDGFNMVPGVEGNFYPARQAGRPWALGFMWDAAHDFANSATLFVPWTVALYNARVPADWDPLAGPPKLKDIRLEDGWLGDCTTWDTTWPTIVKHGQFKGDLSRTVWLPDQATAFVWRAFQSRGAPVVLQAAAEDSSAKLGDYKPKTERGMMVNPGIAIVLDVSVAEGTAIKRVRYYEGDRMLGESAAAPWRFVWRDVKQGAHAVLATWETADGKPGTTTPAMVVVRGKAR